jgi:endonuclease YncB( thermonuclease family)
MPPWLTILGLYCLTATESEGLMRSHIPPACAFRKLAPSAIASLFLCGMLNLLGCAVANRTASIGGSYRAVERAIDGDTLVLVNGERVRLIGVDTPETKHLDCAPRTGEFSPGIEGSAIGGFS